MKHASSLSLPADGEALRMFVNSLNTILVMAGVAVVAAVVAAVALWLRSRQPSDLGTVSHHWVAELRAGEPYDSSR